MWIESYNPFMKKEKKILFENGMLSVHGHSTAQHYSIIVDIV